MVSILLGLMLVLLGFRFSGPRTVPRQFVYPKSWPKPVYDFKRNPLTEEGFELGRNLFYDPILSGDSSISCASCHLSFTGFTHVDHAVSHGIEGRIGRRNTLALVNLAWNKSFHWDGGVLKLDQQAINPISHPDEMGSNLNASLKKLSKSAQYRKMFYKAFRDSIPNTTNLLKGLAQFTASLVSTNSKYDLFMAKDTSAHFTEQEKSGLSIFRENCISCHPEPLFTNYSFANTGLNLDSLNPDSGRFEITRKREDIFKFRVPSLRNVAVTFPYMHDGRFRKLKDVINHYATKNCLNTNSKRDGQEGGLIFDDHQKKDILAFLQTLTDTKFIRENKFQHPIK
jgi:cytochrome c peroxidase